MATGVPGNSALSSKRSMSWSSARLNTAQRRRESPQRCAPHHQAESRRLRFRNGVERQVGHHRIEGRGRNEGAVRVEARRLRAAATCLRSSREPARASARPAARPRGASSRRPAAARRFARRSRWRPVRRGRGLASCAIQKAGSSCASSTPGTPVDDVAGSRRRLLGLRGRDRQQRGGEAECEQRTWKLDCLHHEVLNGWPARTGPTPCRCRKPCRVRSPAARAGRQRAPAPVRSWLPGWASSPRRRCARARRCRTGTGRTGTVSRASTSNTA